VLIPELGYRLQLPKDRAGGTALLLARRLTAFGAALGLTTPEYLVPADKVLILSAGSVESQPGAGQTASHHQIEVLPSGVLSSPVQLSQGPEISNGTADRRVRTDWSGTVWIASNSRLRAIALFVGAVQINSLVFNLFGILVPRGNLQED